MLLYAVLGAARSHSSRPAIGMWMRELTRGLEPGRARQALALLASKRAALYGKRCSRLDEPPARLVAAGNCGQAAALPAMVNRRGIARP